MNLILYFINCMNNKFDFTMTFLQTENILDRNSVKTCNFNRLCLACTLYIINTVQLDARLTDT